MSIRPALPMMLVSRFMRSWVMISTMPASVWPASGAATSSAVVMYRDARAGGVPG